MGRLVLLTKSELAEWNTYSDPAWAGFKREWWERGFRRPPTEKQRRHLWTIADARPRDLARWTREAPGTTANEVLTHVFDRWKGVTSEVFDASPNEYDPHERDHKAVSRLADIMRAASERQERSA